MLRRTAIDAHGLAFETQFPGMAGGTGNIQKRIRASGILVPGKAHRKISGVVRRGFLIGIDQKAEACEVFRRGESLLREGQLKRREPIVVQAFDLRALRCEIVGLTVGIAPLVEIMHLLRR